MNPLIIDNLEIHCSRPGTAQLRPMAKLVVAGEAVEVELSVTDLSIDAGNYVLPYDIEQVAVAIAVHAQAHKIKPPLDWYELNNLASDLTDATGNPITESVFLISDYGDSYVLTQEFADYYKPSKLIFRAGDIFEAWEKLKARIAVARIMREIDH